MTEKNAQALFGEIIAKCWEDEAFKAEFIADPESKMAEAGIPVLEGVTYKVIEAPRFVRYVVLPHEETRPAVQEICKLLLNKAESGATIIPENFEVRLIQDTEDTKYLVLPASPKTLTAAELAMVAGGGSTVTATTAVAQAEVAAQVVEVQTVTTTTTSVAEAELAVVVAAACVLI